MNQDNVDGVFSKCYLFVTALPKYFKKGLPFGNNSKMSLFRKTEVRRTKKKENKGTTTTITKTTKTMQNSQTKVNELKLLKLHFAQQSIYLSASIHLFKINNRITRSVCEICSKLTIQTPEQRQ